MGKMWKTNKNEHEQRRGSQSRSPSPAAALSLTGPCSSVSSDCMQKEDDSRQGLGDPTASYLITANARLSRGSRPQQFTFSTWQPFPAEACVISHASLRWQTKERESVHLPLNLTLLKSQEIVL